MFNKKLLPVVITTVILSLGYANNSFAAAFQLIEQSGKGAGNAHAGEAARAEDASTVFFNPAGMMRLSGHQAEVALHFIIPKFDFQGASAFNAEHPSIQAARLAGVPFDSSNTNSGAGINAIVPNFYYVHDYSKKLKFGMGVNVPFGLQTEYDQQWAGRYSAIKSNLMTLNLNPSIAYRLNSQVSIGGGVNLMYAQTELSNAVDYNLFYNFARFKNPQLPTLSLKPGNISGDGIAKVDGDDWGFGFNLGLLLEPRQGTRFGFSYRSKISLNISGDASFSNPSDPSSAQAVNILRQATNLFKDSKASSSIDLPETIAVNFYQDISSNLAIMGGINWTRWERIKNLVIKFDNAAQPDSITNLNYKNSTFSSLGLNYKYTPQLSLKTGIAYDKSPVTNAQERSARIPDDDRFWIAFGASYQTANKQLSFDFGYSHLFIDDIEIDSSEAYSAGGSTVGYHRLTGEYSAQVDILSLQLNWIF